MNAYEIIMGLALKIYIKSSHNSLAFLQCKKVTNIKLNTVKSIPM